MADLIEQTRLQPHGRPRSDREYCIRGALAAWNSPGMNQLAADGHLHNLWQHPSGLPETLPSRKASRS